ncbi:hypothetical protein ANN_19211 [Periplaneta americana]|uniref:Nuclease HARBI1 n=1 Tax=Periplaneta americana TaxID=6978 RepID=A0ABQ8S9J7_PERAM|nr:hypothetical protein ANN_19211 [Periplaneta americana]
MAARRYVLQAVLLHEDIRNLAVQRPLNVRRNDFTDLSEAKFLERYRISKAVTLKVLEEIQERLEYHNQRNYPLSSMHQLLIALRYYASGSFQLVMADNAGVSKATVCRTISKVSAAIGALRPNYINNLQQENIAEIKRGFYDLAHFPGVVGALDCTHIQIQSPGWNREQDDDDDDDDDDDGGGGDDERLMSINDGNCYTGRKKMTIWQEEPVAQRGRRRAQNIVIHLSSPKRAARIARTHREF